MKHDETIEGGKYLIGGVIVDAKGEPVKEESKSDKSKNFGQMNKAELLAAAKDAGIEVPEGATNPQIIELLDKK